MRRNEREEVGNTIKTLICTALKGDYADEGMIFARECKEKLMKLLRKQILQDTNIKVITKVKTSIEKNLQPQEPLPYNNNITFNQPLVNLFLENQDVVTNTFELSPKNHMGMNINVKKNMNHKNNLFSSNNKLEKSNNGTQDQPVKKKKIDLKRKRKEMDINIKPLGSPTTVCLICQTSNLPFKIGSKKFRNHLCSCAHTSPTKKSIKYYSVTIKANINKVLYALELLLPHETGTFYDIDQMLRKRWMECCTQHQSKLRIPINGENTKLNSHIILSSQESWNTLASKLIGDTQNVSCSYQFDTENPTNCVITFNGIVSAHINLKKKLKQLTEFGCIMIAHNSPYDYPCLSCNLPSNFIECTTNSYKCSNCISIQERYTLCNSPRLGTCLYQYHPN
eukprot:TRINITY_DN6507_c0_g1_i1.p1 TRINITY_DN6507_c0_g1~~TRINITY_DN6507_c0_g1_i1.p1  ORF type:complete len:395 (-),score=64.28 TRINITY_DN6507_c0_g1_i1:154-1338(-)